MPRPLSENPQVREVRKTGRFSPDSHQVSHFILNAENPLACGFSA